MVSVNSAFSAKKIVSENLFSVNEVYVFVACRNSVVKSSFYHKPAFFARNGVIVVIAFGNDDYRQPGARLA